jgi:hypothetical protein
MNNRLFGIIIIATGLLLGVILTPTIILSGTGGISASIKYLGILFGLITLIRPGVSPWILTVLFFSQDYFKKIATFYGIASEQVLYEVMGVSYGVCIAAAVGSLITLSRRHHSPFPAAMMYFIGATVTLIVLAIGLQSETLIVAGYNAAAFGLPSVMATLIYIYFSSDLKRVENLIKLQFLFSVVWALVALKQVYIGYSEVDYFYMRSGLSPTATMQFFTDIASGNKPRPFGMGSGSPSLNSIACFGFYGIWRAFSYSNLEGSKFSILKRIIYCVGGLLICLAMFEGRLKTSIACLVLCWVFYSAYLNKWLTIAFYTSGVLFFVLLVSNSTYVLDNLASWDSVVASKLGDNYSIQTFSDRLKSFETLKDAKYYSLLGTDTEYYIHDFISLVLVKSGVVGLLALLTSAFTGTYYIHSWTWKLPKNLRPFYAALLTMLIPFTALIGLGGRGDLHVTPNNLRIWTLIGCIIVTIVRARQVRMTAKASISSAPEVLKMPHGRGYLAGPAPTPARSH